jgi:hypothetical protein
MVDPVLENAEEKRLDPAVARVQARLQRLMLIAGLTLGVGILAVFLAIVYRITATNNKIEVVSTDMGASAPAAMTAAEPVQATPPPAASEPVVEPQSQQEPTPEAESTPPFESAPASTAGPVPLPVPSPRLPPLESPGQIEMGSVPSSTDEALLVAKATVPADARLVASTVAGGRIVLTYDHFAGTIVMIIDPETLEVVGRLDLAPE